MSAEECGRRSLAALDRHIAEAALAAECAQGKAVPAEAAVPDPAPAQDPGCITCTCCDP